MSSQSVWLDWATNTFTFFQPKNARITAALYLLYSILPSYVFPSLFPSGAHSSLFTLPFSALPAFYPSFLPSFLYLGLLDTSSYAETESKPEMVSAFMEQVVWGNTNII